MKLSEVLKLEYIGRYPNKNNVLLRSFLCYYRDPDFRVVVLIRYAVDGNSNYYRKKCVKKLLIKYNVAISRNCKIGQNFHPEHYLGLVIGPGVVIGNNCTTYQQVTIGQKNGKYPTIGENVTLYAGCKVLGNINIGNNVEIGANAVVLKDVPDNCIAVGVPARIISKEA